MTINGLNIDDNKRQHCLIITRVMGYHQNKETFNAGKLSEANKRALIDENHMNKSLSKLTKK
jgi:hypothetical protein